jgi:hypothetical protein
MRNLRKPKQLLIQKIEVCIFILGILTHTQVKKVHILELLRTDEYTEKDFRNISQVKQNVYL